MFIWKEQKDGTLEAEVDRLKLVLEEEDGMWFGSIYDGTARISRTRGKSNTAVVATLTKRVPRVLRITPGKCEACAGATYPHTSGAARCLSRGCSLFKKKV